MLTQRHFITIWREETLFVLLMDTLRLSVAASAVLRDELQNHVQLTARMVKSLEFLPRRQRRLSAAS